MEGGDAFLIVEAAGYAPDAIGLAVVSIVAGLVQDIGKDKQAAGEPDSKPEEVDERDELVFGQVTESDLEIIF